MMCYITNTVVRGENEMNKWRGLLIKEWFLTKHWIYATFVLNVLLTFVLPVMVTLYLPSTVTLVSEGFTWLSPFWLLAVVMTPTIIFMMSLGKEARRPDICLHSPSSIYVLFGMKSLFSIIVGVVNLCISLVLLMGTLSLRIAPFGFVYESGTFQFWLVYMGVLFLATIMIMFVGLFFYVVYLVIRPFTKKFSMVVTFGLLLGYLWIGSWVVNSSVYITITRIGKFGAVKENRFNLAGEGFYFSVNESVFYAGQILLNIGLASLLFIAAALLFEKKARL